MTCMNDITHVTKHIMEKRSAFVSIFADPIPSTFYVIEMFDLSYVVHAKQITIRDSPGQL